MLQCGKGNVLSGICVPVEGRMGIDKKGERNASWMNGSNDKTAVSHGIITCKN